MFNELFARITTWVMTARDEAGQGLVEYALILAFVSVLSIAALTLLSTEINGVFDTVQDALTP
jgi:pilus assembly protein Flp/PilA